jgi:nucleoside-diphosphate-sugar epimerase
MEQYSADERERGPGGSREPKVEYAAMLLGATGNVGGHILHLLVQSPLCKKVVVVTRRNVAELANPKVQQVVVNMDRLEKELARQGRPHCTCGLRRR